MSLHEGTLSRFIGFPVRELLAGGQPKTRVAWSLKACDTCEVKQTESRERSAFTHETLHTRGSRVLS